MTAVACRFFRCSSAQHLPRFSIVLIPTFPIGVLAQAFAERFAYPGVLGMEGFSEITKRLQAVTTILQNRPQEVRVGVSSSQGGIIVKMLQQGHFSVENLACIAQAARASGLEPRDVAAIEECIDEKMSSETTDARLLGGRMPLQQYEHLVDYLTAEVWLSLSNNEPDPLFEHLAKLGLRNPSEPTKQVIACLLMVAAKGMEGALQLSGAMKTNMHKTAGQLFSRSVSGAQSPLEFVHVLPRAPSEFKANHPKLYALAFGSSVPVPMAYDKFAFAELRRTTKMRKRKFVGDTECASLSSAGGSQGTASLSALLPAFVQAMQSLMGTQPSQQPSVTMQYAPFASQPPTKRLVDLVLSPHMQVLSPSPPRPMVQVAQPETALVAPPAQSPPTAKENGETQEASAEKRPSEGAIAALPVVTREATPPATPQVKPEAPVVALSSSVRKLSVEEAAANIQAAYQRKVALRRPAAATSGTAQEAETPPPGGNALRKEKAKVVPKSQLPQISHEASRKQFLARVPKSIPLSSKVFKYSDSRTHDQARRDAAAHCRWVCQQANLVVERGHQF